MTTPTDFRALCAELNKWVIELAASHPNLSYSGIARLNELVDRTAAALAQPEPQGAICSPCEWWGAEVENECKLGLNPPRSLADCAFSRFDAQPEPQGLKEEALKALGPEPLPETGPTGDTILNKGSIERYRTIRRALETLND